MTWLDRLRQLDTRLTNGEISAADYRKARDEILAEASSGKRPVGGESPKGESWIPAHPGPMPATPPSPPAAPPTPASPKPPVAAAAPEMPLIAEHSPGAAAAQAESDAGETTQVIADDRPTGAVADDSPTIVHPDAPAVAPTAHKIDGPTAPAVQAVPAGQPAQPTEDDEPTQVVDSETTGAAGSADSADDEETEVVRANVVAAATPARRPVPELPEFSPRVPRPQYARAAPIQGEQVFAEARASQSSLAVRVLVPLTILVVVGVAVWWFAFRQDDQPPAAQDGAAPVSASQAPPPPQQTRPPVRSAAQVAKQVPKLPGKAKEPSTGTLTVAEARDQKLLNPAYAQLLADNGVQELVYRKSARGEFGFLLLAAPLQQGREAADLATAGTGNLQQAGFAPARPAESGGVPVITRNDQFFRTFVAMYDSGEVWVQINVSGPPDGNAAALRKEFDKVLTSVTKELPAA